MKQAEEDVVDFLQGNIVELVQEGLLAGDRLQHRMFASGRKQETVDRNLPYQPDQARPHCPAG